MNEKAKGKMIKQVDKNYNGEKMEEKSERRDIEESNGIKNTIQNRMEEIMTKDDKEDN